MPSVFNKASEVLDSAKRSYEVEGKKQMWEYFKYSIIMALLGSVGVGILFLGLFKGIRDVFYYGDISFLAGFVLKFIIFIIFMGAYGVLHFGLDRGIATNIEENRLVTAQEMLTFIKPLDFINYFWKLLVLTIIYGLISQIATKILGASFFMVLLFPLTLVLNMLMTIGRDIIILNPNGSISELFKSYASIRLIHIGVMFNLLAKSIFFIFLSSITVGILGVYFIPLTKTMWMTYSKEIRDTTI